MTQPRPCTCERVTGPVYTADQCRVCWHAHHTPAYQQLWGLPVTATPGHTPPAAPPPTAAALRAKYPRLRDRCPHEGPKLPGEPCGSPLHRCQLDGATYARLDPCTRAARCCQDCPFHPLAQAPAAPDIQTRHLIYHLYPHQGPAGTSAVWRWNLEQLFRPERIGLFNGRRVLAVAEDGTTPPRRLLERVVAGRAELLFFPNDPARLEVASFDALYSAVETLDRSHVTLWAHGKGSSKPPGSTSQTWAAMLYETYLDYWPLVRALLGRHPCAGSFKKRGQFWSQHAPASLWHYSGSWVWFRNRDVFMRPDWRDLLPRDLWCGIEPLPSLYWTVDEAGTIFCDGGPDLDLYSPTYLRDTIAPALDRWRAAHAHQRTPA